MSGQSIPLVSGGLLAKIYALNFGATAHHVTRSFIIFVFFDADDRCRANLQLNTEPGGASWHMI